MLPALVALLSFAPSLEPVPQEEPSPFSFAAVPTATFDTDEGFGTGGVVTLYHSDGETKPYRDAVTVNVFVSSKLVQHHAITWDALKPFDVDGRLYLRLGYYSTVSENYCGVGNDVTCAPGEAVAHAALVPAFLRDDNAAARDDFIRHYYLMRFQRPYANLVARPWLRGEKPYRVEGLLGWRGSLAIPGDLLTSSSAPYPGSLYAQDHPDGEPGFSSVPFIGLIVDDRDDETFPTRGIYAEAHVRASHPFTGSSWNYVGGGAQLRGFSRLLTDGGVDVVLATRLVGDAIFGDASTEDLARIGGTLDTLAFGGSTIGRGIREQRYIGPYKVLGQVELRAKLVDTELFGQRFNHGTALFSDVAWIGAPEGGAPFGTRPLKLLSTLGLSYRLLWNDNFSIRTDLAVSPDENDGPGFYVIVGQAF